MSIHADGAMGIRDRPFDPAQDRPPSTEPVVSPVEPLGAGFDREALLARVDGDPALLREVVGLFLEEYPKRLGELRAALARHDSTGVASAAHGLKGTLSYFAAGTVVDAARRLEAMGRAGDLRDAEAACAILEEALGRLTPALGALAREGPA